MQVQLQDPDHDYSSERRQNASPKIGGFLIVVAILLILSLLQNLGSFLWSVAPFQQGRWQRLTTAGSSVYDPNWKLVLYFGLISSLVIVLGNVIVLFLFFRKHRVVPKLIVTLLPLIFITSLIGYYIDGLVPAISVNPGYAKQPYELILKFVELHLWIPYFLISDRVQRTFVR